MCILCLGIHIQIVSIAFNKPKVKYEKFEGEEVGCESFSFFKIVNVIQVFYFHNTKKM